MNVIRIFDACIFGVLNTAMIHHPFVCSYQSGGTPGQLSLSKSVTVVEGLGSAGGKWPSALGNVVLLEAK